MGLSGKINPLLAGTKAFGYLGLGFIEVGPVTTDTNKSNAPQFTKERDNIVYAYTLETLGIEGIVNKLKDLQEFNKPIFIRIGVTDSIQETISFILAGIFISIVGITGVFIPTDLMYIRLSPEQLKEINNHLIPVIAHDWAGFGSALLSVGLLVLMLALWGFQQGEKWVWYTFLIGGIPAFSAGIVTHFVIGYTNFSHLLPAYIAVLLFVAGLILTKDFFFKKNEPYVKSV